MKEPRSVAQLSHAVAEILSKEVNETNRFASMDLCEEILQRCDRVSVHDQCMRGTLRTWIVRIQDRFQ